MELIERHHTGSLSVNCQFVIQKSEFFLFVCVCFLSRWIDQEAVGDILCLSGLRYILLLVHRQF